MLKGNVCGESRAHKIPTNVYIYIRTTEHVRTEQRLWLSTFPEPHTRRLSPRHWQGC